MPTLYESIEHTADIGIRVKAKDLKSLFKNAALAVFQIAADKKSGARRTKSTKTQKLRKLTVNLQADTLEDLFLDWLNELLSLSSAKGLIFEDFAFQELNEHTVKATVVGRAIENYTVHTEIKAATYHKLKVEKTKTGWQAEVILDV